MARAHNVYVAQDEYDKVLATFTVKHEMQTWARRRRDDLTHVCQPFRVLRFHDGDPQHRLGGHTILTHEEIFGRD